MKIRYFVILFLFSLQLSVSQNYKLVDKVVQRYPNFENINTLSIRIQNDFKTDHERVRAIFTWIAMHIDYDLEKARQARKRLSYFYKDEQDLQEQIRQFELRLIGDAMVNKKTLCRGFSLLFKELCSKMNIQSEVIKGITKVDPSEINTYNTIKDHAWNAVRINNEWHLLDVTWATGFEDVATQKWIKTCNDYYFLTPPVQFINSHYPESKKWQLLTNTISLGAFFSQPILYPNYFDSGVRLANHQRGLINRSSNNVMIIQFATKKNGSQLYYKFNTDTYARPLRLQLKNDTFYIAEVMNTETPASFLTVFQKNKPIIEFKIR